METQRQQGTPSALRNGEDRAGRFLRHHVFRISIFPVVPAIALLVIFLADPKLARAQQWPDASTPGLPQDGNSRSLRDVPTDVSSGIGADPLAAIESNTGMLPLMPVDNSRLVNAESCQTWTSAALNSPTVSVARLEVPGKASHEFQKACGDFKDRKLKSAEEHAREAVKIYPNYAAAWVVLGQILQEQHKYSEAIDACRKAKDADPDYAPPYICLAGFAARVDDWDEAYSLASRALSLDPATDPYAFLYTATADFHLKRMDQAVLYALSAEKLDQWNRVPEVHLLLAELYDVRGDRLAEAGELRKFVKSAPHDSDWVTARTTLAALEQHPPTK